MIIGRLRDPWCVLSLVGLAGCASGSVTPIIGPDGDQNQLITCYQVESCYQKAHEICGGPYKIINTNSETSGFQGTTTTEVKLLVKCGK